jgi:hypothetical protein
MAPLLHGNYEELLEFSLWLLVMPICFKSSLIAVQCEEHCGRGWQVST